MRKTLKLALAGALAAIAAAFAGPTAVAAPVAAENLETTFFTGTIQPGASGSWHWNNANPHSVSYVVGLSPKGASTTQPCRMEVVRTWYRQNWGGEREFHYTIKNVGSIACGADVLLYSLPDITGDWNTGGIAPGASVTKRWNNANPLDSVRVAGVSPIGATSNFPCDFEVTREWYVQQPGGEREFYFTLTNVGQIACTADILLGMKSSFNSSNTGVVPVDGTEHHWWNNANPVTAAHIVGFAPVGATAQPCQFEATRQWYEQRLNSGVAEREFHFIVENVGAIACSADRKLAVA